MIVESRQGRRVLGRLARGVELVEALGELCSERSVRRGEVRGFGTLLDVTLRAVGADGDVTYRYGRPCNLLQLTASVTEHDGRLFVEASGTVARGSDNGIEVLGGRIVSAHVESVEIVVEAFDDVAARREQEGGVVQWSEAPVRARVTSERVATPADESTATTTTRTAFERAAPPPPAPPPPAPPPERAPTAVVADAGTDARGWGDVIAASERAGEPPAAVAAVESPADEAIRAGDVIEHVKFGRCEVERVEGDYEYAQVRLRNGRLVRLSLDVLVIERAGMEGTRRRFRAVPPR